MRGFCSGYPERFLQFFLVESDDHIVVDKDNRYSHLAGALNHFFALNQVRGNIMFGVGNIALLEKILCHLAEMAGRGTVDGNLLHGP